LQNSVNAHLCKSTHMNRALNDPLILNTKSPTHYLGVARGKGMTPAYPSFDLLYLKS
jgi:hypothetical protein